MADGKPNQGNLGLTQFSLAKRRVWVAGHRGMVGSALVRRLAHEDCEVITAPRSELDLTDQASVRGWLSRNRPSVIIIAAAKVGGILANSTRPAEFIYDNLMIEANIIDASQKCGVEKLLFLGSSCIYPKYAEQPIREDSLLTGTLEPTNEWYAIAKIAGIKLAAAYRRQYKSDFISAMPTNLYGVGDNFNPESSHVLPALIRKAHESKTKRAEVLEIWGSGTPMREFLYADDCADACIFLLKNYSAEEHVNIGSGREISILDLAAIVCEVVGCEANIITDPSKPDGTPRKLMSSEKLNAMGWQAQMELREGIGLAYRWFLSNCVEK